MNLPSAAAFDLSIAAYAALISFAACVLLCPRFIPWLHKLKYGQPIRTDGPQTHLKKSGTPTMGGIVIIICVLLGSAFFMKDNPEGLLIIFVTVAFGIIGFCDDYLKVVKKNPKGLRSLFKFTAQAVITGVFIFLLYKINGLSTQTFIPFSNGKYLDLGFLYIPFIFLAMLGTVNGANFTDGLDGLASGVTILIVIFFVFLGNAMGFTGLLPTGGAAVGTLLGFLLFNTFPARVFMGDTGSLALGGLVSATAVIMKMPLLILFVGVIYLSEVISVMLQVGYFKLTHGKRIFKMAPLHHHFEQLGHPETKVVAMFYIVTAIGCLVGYLATNKLF